MFATKRLVAALPLVAAMLIPAAAQAPETTQPDKPTVVSQKRIYPVHYKLKRMRFEPWARPSANQARRIAQLEARRARIPLFRLTRRIQCESGWYWAASNGSYHGLLQFHPSTFRRGMSSIGSRKVRLKVSRVLWRHTKLVTHWSDGRREIKRGKRVAVRRTRVYTGWIPKYPAVTHSWAQLRIGSQAIAGRSAVGNGEWSCH